MRKFLDAKKIVGVYAGEIFEMLSAMDSMPTKTNTPAASTEDKVNETRTVNEDANLETVEFCDAHPEISKEETYAPEQREHDNIVELEKGGSKKKPGKILNPLNQRRKTLVSTILS